MKVWQKSFAVSAVLSAALPVLVNLYSCAAIPEGAVPIRDIVSFCIGDATNDGALELLVISGGGENDAGERCGEFLLVCNASAHADMEKLGYIPPEKINYRIDLAAINPMKVQLGDVNGDGVNEVAICAYKTAQFHPVMAKRPFFFDLVEGNLIPVWLGSRLSRPFDDYILYDIDGDDTDEIISVERLENDDRVVAAYKWRGFGFEMLAQSEAYGGELRFDMNAAGETKETREVGVIFYSSGEHAELNFRLYDGNLISG